MPMSDWFWRLAFKIYNNRKPSLRFEAFAIGGGAIFAILYAVGVLLNPTFGNTLRLIVAAAIVALGLAHRRIRLERQKGTDALYRKMLATKE